MNQVERIIALRPAHDDDAAALRRLAALDDALPVQGPSLLALIDGEPVAALSLADARVVANPFLLTEDAVAMLRLRHEQLLRADPVGRGRRRAVLPSGGRGTRRLRAA